jgi:hypothetical protein
MKSNILYIYKWNLNALFNDWYENLWWMVWFIGP